MACYLCSRKPHCHFLNLCWSIVNWAPRNNQYTMSFIQYNLFENVCKVSIILCRLQCLERYFASRLIFCSNAALTHWGWVTHICVGRQTIIGSDNGLLPERCQAIIWTNAGILLNWTLGKKLNRNLNIFIQENGFENVVWKMSAILSQPQCVKFWVLFSLNDVTHVLNQNWFLLLLATRHYLN